MSITRRGRRGSRAVPAAERRRAGGAHARTRSPASSPTSSGAERGTLKGLLGEGLRFAGSGLVLLPTGLAVSALLHEGAGLRQDVAAGVAIGVMLVLSFLLARNFIFRSPGQVRRQLPRFAAVSLSMRGAEYLMFLFLYDVVHLYYLLAMTLALALSFTIKFTLYRTLVFGRPTTPAGRLPARSGGSS